MKNNKKFTSKDLLVMQLSVMIQQLSLNIKDNGIYKLDAIDLCDIDVSPNSYRLIRPRVIYDDTKVKSQNYARGIAYKVTSLTGFEELSEYFDICVRTDDTGDNKRVSLELKQEYVDAFDSFELDIMSDGEVRFISK